MLYVDMRATILTLDVDMRATILTLGFHFNIDWGNVGMNCRRGEHELKHFERPNEFGPDCSVR